MATLAELVAVHTEAVIVSIIEKKVEAAVAAKRKALEKAGKPVPEDLSVVLKVRGKKDPVVEAEKAKKREERKAKKLSKLAEVFNKMSQEEKETLLASFTK